LAGDDELGLSDLRRAFSLVQLQAGVSEIVIARLMRHTTTALIASMQRRLRATWEVYIIRQLAQSESDG
jgi:hypothetical protein